MTISKFKKESIYEAFCSDCSVGSYGQCCCIVMGEVASANLLNCPHREEVKKMIYGEKHKPNFSGCRGTGLRSGRGPVAKTQKRYIRQKKS